MPRKFKIILWVAGGLVIATMVVIGSYQLSGTMLSAFAWTMFSLLLASGILIVYWTNKTITQASLKRYLLLAGASAMGIIIFQGVHLFVTEAALVMALFVCPIALIIGMAKALQFKSSSTN
jgi:hypothetical protein